MSHLDEYFRHFRNGAGSPRETAGAWTGLEDLLPTADSLWRRLVKYAQLNFRSPCVSSRPSRQPLLVPASSGRCLKRSPPTVPSHTAGQILQFQRGTAGG